MGLGSNVEEEVRFGPLGLCISCSMFGPKDQSCHGSCPGMVLTWPKKKTCYCMIMLYKSAHIYHYTLDVSSAHVDALLTDSWQDKA